MGRGGGGGLHLVPRVGAAAHPDPGFPRVDVHWPSHLLLHKPLRLTISIVQQVYEPEPCLAHPRTASGATKPSPDRALPSLVLAHLFVRMPFAGHYVGPLRRQSSHTLSGPLLFGTASFVVQNAESRM